MTAHELVELISTHEPELLEKIAEVLQEAEAEGPEAMSEVLQGFSVVASRISEHEKTAEDAKGLRDHIREGAGKAIGATAVSLAAGLAAAGGSDLYHYAKGKLTKHRNWKRMMEHNPHWSKGSWDEHNPMSEEHRKNLPKAFSTLHRLAPDVASDPITASHYTRQLATGVASDDALKRLSDTQKAIREGREKSRLRP